MTAVELLLSFSLPSIGWFSNCDCIDWSITRLAHDMDVDDDDVPVQMGKSCSKLALEEEPRRRNPAPFPADVTHILASRLDGKVAAGTDTTKREG